MTNVLYGLAQIGLVLTAMTCCGAYAVELVRNGRSVASIVIPARPLPVESYAAQELQYHIEASTGVRLQIVSESEDSASGNSNRVYLGNCQAARRAKLNPSALPGNGYLNKTLDKDLFVVGKDSEGDPLDLDTHEGTLFGVYDLLENEMRIRWLWPGKLGEIIPRQENLDLAPKDARVIPLKQAELILEVQRTHEKAVDTRNTASFVAAYRALKEFRDANVDYDKANFAGLTGDEQKWEKEIH